MNTIYLKVDTLQHVLDTNSIKPQKVELIYKNYKIYVIIDKCHIFPTVISNIIYEYTYTTIVLMCDKKMTRCGTIFSFKNNNFNFTLRKRDMSSGRFGIYCDTSKIIINYGDGIGSTLPLFNMYYEKIYNIKDYFNPSMFINDHETSKASYFIHKNIIGILYCNVSHVIVIHDHRKFKHLIVIIKCIINAWMNKLKFDL